MGLATDSYDRIPQLVVQGRGKLHAHEVGALHLASIVVRDESPQLELLRSIKDSEVADISLVTLNADQPDPLEVVTDGDADYAIVDANEFDFARQLQVRLVIEPLPDEAAMRAALSAGSADLAAAQISPDARWL